MPTDDNWGSLINPDKSPAPLLEHLCLGIAQLIGTFENNRGTSDLTPERLAEFYQKVGGNYDTLFLDTKGPALSFIYQSLGCFHSLQPSANCFEAPSIPALLPSGFIRWQTIQLLLDPDEHSEYLQNAVAEWDIPRPDGSTFPKSIPRDAFPAEPDSEMVQWHEEVSRRLEYDYWKRNTPRPSPSVGAQSNYASPGETLPNDEYFSRSHRTHDGSHSPHRTRHQWRNTGEYPSRKVHSAFFPRPESHRPGFASPRAPSPPPWPNRHSKSEKRHTFKFPFSFGTESDASSEESGSSHNRSGKQYSHRNLGVSGKPRARPHSHEAYSRKPRDISPDYTRRNSYRDPHPRPSKRHGSDRRSGYSPNLHADEPPRRPTSVRFREFALDPAAIGEEHAHPHPYARPANAYVPRRAEEDVRRASYSSRGGSSGSSSERSRPFTPAGHRAPKWANPAHSPRCVPVCVADNVVYTPGRAGIYEQ